jgi:two-component system NtrC family sensor kinase
VFIRDITVRKQIEDELQAEKNKLQSVIDALVDHLTIRDKDYNLIYQSESSQGVFGNHLGEKCYRVYEGQDELCDSCPVEKAFKDGKSHTSERKTVTPSGEVIFWETTANLIRDAKGEIVSCLEVARDITARKQAEEKLRDETTRHRILIDESSDGIVILDESGGVYEANRRFAEMLGYTPEEARELHVWDWEFQFPREKVAEMLASIGPEGDHFETLHRRKDGTIYDVEISTNGAVYAGQKLIFCVCRDITARKQAEAALKESEEKYKTLVEATSDIIWEVDEKGTFSFVSPKIKELLGYEVDEVVGKKRTLDLIAKREFRRLLRRFKEINAKREPFFNLEIPHLHKNGSLIICEVSGIPLLDSAGNFKGYVGIDKDITERRQMQEQLVIADRLASVGELAAGIAHELNNPLTGVIGFSQLLLDKEMPADIKEDIEVVYSEAQRASQVVKNLLTFARKHTAAKEKVNINDIINKVLELRAYEQKLESITVDARLDANLPEVMADYFQLQQVFLNIVINAEYFMKEANHKGNLTITTEKVGNKIRASFADDGPGIADENLGHLFDPFFTTKEVGMGTGLGLSICHGIVAEHGGRIYVESELGKGAAFIVELAIGAAERKGGAA